MLLTIIQTSKLLIMGAINPFDTIFYLLTRFFYRLNKIPVHTAILFVSLSQVVLLLDIVEMVAILTDKPVKGWISKESATGLLIVASGGIFFINNRKYNWAYSKIKVKWRKDSLNAKISKALFGLLTFTLPFILFFLLMNAFGEK
jgi:hypothetical protein